MGAGMKRVIFGLALSAFLLWLAVRDADFMSVWFQLDLAHLALAGLALVSMGLGFVARAARWRFLIPGGERLSFNSLMGATMIGYMTLNLLPLRIGEFVRAYVLGRRESIPKSGVFATIVVERICDGFSVLLFLILSLTFLPFELEGQARQWVGGFTAVAVGFYLLGLLVVILVRFNRSLVIGLAAWPLGPWPRLQAWVREMVEHFATALTALNTLRQLFHVILLSLANWLFTIGYYWILLFGFSTVQGANAGVHASFFGAAFLTVAVAFGIMLPSSPGFVGAYEFACVMGLGVLGLDRNVALSYALVSHAAQYLGVTLAGFAYLWAFSLKLGGLSKTARHD